MSDTQTRSYSASLRRRCHHRATVRRVIVDVTTGRSSGQPTDVATDVPVSRPVPATLEQRQLAAIEVEKSAGVVFALTNVIQPGDVLEIDDKTYGVRLIGDWTDVCMELVVSHG